MSRELILRPEAEADLAEAFAWYEGREAGLGMRFLDEIEAVQDLIARQPEVPAVLHRGVRRVLSRRFPFAVFYVVEPTRVVVIAILHQARDPERWKART